MSPHLRYRLRILATIVVICVAVPVLAKGLIALFLGYFPDVDRSFFHLGLELERSLVQGLIVGLSVGLLELFVFGPRLRRRPLPVLLLTKAVAYVGIVVLAEVVGAVEFVERAYGDRLGSVAFAEHFATEVWSVGSGYTIAIHGLAVVLAVLVVELERVLGRHALGRLLTGTAFAPKRQVRLLLFIDLRDSTGIAERVGDLSYSRLIRECFSDLTEPVIRSGAEVYQYVGDEAVLIWKVTDEGAVARALRAFYQFHQILQGRAAHYEKHYGVVPVFKAGAHIGPLVLAEVGEVKREIAYHGDTINTTARIQALCNEVGTLLLISEPVRERLPADFEFEVGAVESIPLRGKEEAVGLFSVTL